MNENKFSSPFTSQERQKQSLIKKLSPVEMISQKIPFPAEPHIMEYFKLIQASSLKAFVAAQDAKKSGADLSDVVEVTPAVDLADRAETIIGLPGLAKRFREIFAEAKDRRKAYFQLFREILEEKWWKMDSDQKKVEVGIKTCLLIETEGVVVAPLDGVPKVEINSNPDGSKYIDIYYAGPIRAAGGSSTVIPLILGDYARNYLKLGTYKPTEDEVERYVEEIGIYQTEVVSRQYTMKDDEIRIIIRGCPVCINGVPTEENEVSAHRDLSRIPTNRIRGGMGLVVTEGLALKALWVMKTAKDLGLGTNWDFLEKIVKVEKSQAKIEVKPNRAFLDRLAAGRPILSYPSTWGGFRLRYGRGRNTGIMAKAISPASMIIFDEFIAVGTHGRIERPGKATQFFPCSTIDGPIVLLKDKSVMRINTAQEAENIKASLDKIIYVGDLLATFGDFKKSAHPLIPVGYCEEWWVLELKKACAGTAGLEKLKSLGCENLLIASLGELRSVPESLALLISKELGVPLHPNFLHFYRALNIKEIICLREFLQTGVVEINEQSKKQIMVLENKIEEKKFLEKIGLPHAIKNNSIVIEDFVKSLCVTFGINSKNASKKENVLDYLSEISGLVIRDKAGSFIGGRMGRPEQAKPRQMKGNPHVLFPIGLKGGSTRSINKAIDQNYNESGKASVDIAQYFCPHCKKISVNHTCFECKVRGVRLNYCKHCQKSVSGDKCGICGANTVSAGEHEINLLAMVERAKHILGDHVLPDPIKGVKGMIAEVKEVEPIEKGILRAKHDVHIFRDGTSRFELLNAVITHFKPKELNLSVEKVLSLGYINDICGAPITSVDQIIEIYPQDIVVHESCGEWLVKVSKFIDDELEKFYNVPRFYNAAKKEDLIGELVLGLAPHTSAAVNGRILGYSKARLGFGHPYFVCAKRRNCLPFEEQVIIESQGDVELIEIGKLADDSRVKSLAGVYALSVDSKGDVKKRRILDITRRKSPDELLKLTTKTGRRLFLTKEHKMLLAEEGGISKKAAEMLLVNDTLISLKKKIPFKENMSINLFDYYFALPESEKKKIRVHGAKTALVGRQTLREKIKETGFVLLAKKIGWRTGKAIHTAFDFDAVPLDLFEKITRYYGLDTAAMGLRISYAKQKSAIPGVVPLTKELGELCGLFLSDGCAKTSDNGQRQKYVYQVNIISTEKLINKKILDSAKLLGARPTIEANIQSDGEPIWLNTISGRVYYDFFTKILGLGKTAKTKMISPTVINSNIPFIEGLIGGYLVGDGYIDSNSIKASSVNKKLLNGVTFLLLQLGTYPHLGEAKREILNGSVYEHYKKQGKRLFCHEYILRLYSTDLIKIGKLLFGEKEIKHKKILLSQNFRKKRQQTMNDFVLDKIKSISIVKAQSDEVFDLVVEGEKNYVGGFGFLGIYDCDGDQDSVMLLMDALLNFSHKYLSHKSGGRMDAPLVFTIIINPSEVDDEVHKMETCWSFPLELYEKSLSVCEPNIAIETVRERLGKSAQYSGIGFTHETELFDEGPKTSRYIQLKTMDEKIQRQNALQKKIMAVNAKDALERVMGSHFLPDIIGNARAFSRQTFRCTNCQEKYRRIPLSGKCYKCGKSTIILTIHEGSVRKYLKIAQNMARQENLSPYLIQRLNMIEKEINSVFKSDTVKQKSLFEFA